MFEKKTDKKQMSNEQIDAAKAKLIGNILKDYENTVEMVKTDAITENLRPIAKQMEKTLAEKGATPCYADFRKNTVTANKIKVDSYERTTENGKVEGGNITVGKSTDHLKYNYDKDANLTSVQYEHIEFVKTADGKSRVNQDTHRKEYVNSDSIDHIPEDIKAVYEAIGIKAPERERKPVFENASQEINALANKLKNAVYNSGNNSKVDVDGKQMSSVYLNKKNTVEYTNEAGDTTYYMAFRNSHESITLSINQDAKITGAKYNDWDGYNKETKQWVDGATKFSSNANFIAENTGSLGAVVADALKAVSYEPIPYQKNEKEADAKGDGFMPEPDFEEVEAEEEMELPFN